VTQKRDIIEGDKAASLHGQKGVCGLIVPEEDLPFTKDGIRPDIVMNPLAYPSRMTIGQLVESLAGKAAALVTDRDAYSAFRKDKLNFSILRMISKELPKPSQTLLVGFLKDFTLAKFEKERKTNIVAVGRLVDELEVIRKKYLEEKIPKENLAVRVETFISILTGEKNKKYKDLFKKDFADLTPFRDLDMQAINDVLRTKGYDCFGDEVVLNGMTGEKTPCLIFTGIVYYQRLKHMIMDKKHECSRASRMAYTHQPKEGRQQHGGLRYGHMERDAAGSIGASAFLKDRLFEQSDDYGMWVCKLCGMPAMVNATKTISECTVCRRNEVAYVKLPYGSKLLMQELFAMGVATRLLPTERGVKVVPLDMREKEKKQKESKKSQGGVKKK
jgi:DNA-directed RNA polymerase beta subunit